MKNVYISISISPLCLVNIDMYSTTSNVCEKNIKYSMEHSRQREICTYPKLILNPIVMLLFSDKFAISSNRLPYLKFDNRFATITNSIAKFCVFLRDKCYCVAGPLNL